ncbi:MAG: hypothetical protein M1827_000868 [Pycnora praestabilis]|nr:MAG: hypothetical protein M1827_000868 [Pycnora praestabilis]
MNGINWTLLYHGSTSGTILADERMEGLSLRTGAEFCTAVEFIYSLTYTYAASLGDSSFADRAELTAYNALPVMITPNNWARQKMSQVNQPYSRNLTKENVFNNVGTRAQTFRLEPHFPRCTVKFSTTLSQIPRCFFCKGGERRIWARTRVVGSCKRLNDTGERC